MRPALLTFLLALLLPAAAAAAVRAPGDGSLSVRDGDGMVTLVVRGAAIGRFDSGVLTVAVADGDCDGPLVWGAERERPVIDHLGQIVACVFSGQNVRFRLVGGKQDLRIQRGRDIDLSAVGRGFGSIRGIGGQYSLNGDAYVPLPDDVRRFSLGG